MIKHFLLSITLLFASLCHPSFGQVATTGTGGLYNVGTVTTVGQLGLPVSYQAVFAPPTSHTFAWFNSGTAPIACTFEVDGSTDGVHWYALTATNNDCTAPNMLHIAYKPVDFIRVQINTYTGAANGTSAVTFQYVRGAE